MSANYCAYAATLMQSLRKTQPSIPRFVVLADAPCGLDGLDLAATLLPCDDLSIPLIENMKLWYTVIEFNTALKPYVFRHLLDRLGYDQVVYLEPRHTGVSAAGGGLGGACRKQPGADAAHDAARCRTGGSRPTSAS